MTMTNNHAIDLFMKIEDSLDPYNYKIDGVYFWERIRFKLARCIMQKAGIADLAHDHIEDTTYNTLRAIKKAIKNIFKNNPYFAAHSDVLFFGHSRRKLRADGNYEDIYCDPIIDSLGLSYVYLENSYLGKHLIPAATKNIFYMDCIYLVATMLRKVKIIKINLSKRDLEYLTTIQKRIKELFEVDFDLVRFVKADLEKRASLIPLFKMLIKMIKPKLIVVVCSYGKEVFIEVAKNSNIKVIELQHGNLSSYHLGYSFPGPKRFKSTFPDYFFSFGEMWNKNVELPIGRDNIVAVGFPYLEREVEKYQNVERKKQVIFLSQGSIGKELSRLTYELSKVDGLTYNIVYKLHPGEYKRWREEYPWLINSSVQVVDNDFIHLYQLMAESRVQVGYNSTALYEGLNFGLKTLLYSALGTGSMQYLIDKKLATEVTTVNEILDVLNQLNDLSPIDTTTIFKNNAINNIDKAIWSLLTASDH